MRKLLRQPHYLATVYHDEPDNAATDSKSEWHPSLNAATEWARAQTSDYWNGYPATVHYGYVIKNDGPVPYWEDDDRERPWLVYAAALDRD